MRKLKQSFQNKTDRPQFINLELSTSRFRLNPKDELVLFYEADDVQDQLGAALRIEFIANGDQLELVVWTHEFEMFFTDGRPAPQDFDPARSWGAASLTRSLPCRHERSRRDVAADGRSAQLRGHRA